MAPLRAPRWWAATHVYKVVFDLESLSVDYEKTEETRKEEFEDKKRRGKTYEEFEKEWRSWND